MLELLFDKLEQNVMADLLKNRNKSGGTTLHILCKVNDRFHTLSYCNIWSLKWNNKML